MFTRLHHWWLEKRSSFWFIPAVMVLDAVVLAIVLITMLPELTASRLTG